MVGEGFFDGLETFFNGCPSLEKKIIEIGGTLTWAHERTLVDFRLQARKCRYFN